MDQTTWVDWATLLVALLAATTSILGVVYTTREARKMWARNQAHGVLTQFLADAAVANSYLTEELVRAVAIGQVTEEVRQGFRAVQQQIQRSSVTALSYADDATAEAILDYVGWVDRGMPKFPPEGEPRNGDPAWTAAMHQGVALYVDLINPIRAMLGQPALPLTSDPHPNRYY